MEVGPFTFIKGDGTRGTSDGSRDVLVEILGNIFSRVYSVASRADAVSTLSVIQ